MKKVFTLIISSCCIACAFAQFHVLTKADKEIITGFEILADNNYSFERIISDSTLPFSHNPLLYGFKKDQTYWVKFSVENPFSYRREYYLSVFPFIDNTLYHFDTDENKWQMSRAGLAGDSANRVSGLFSLNIDNNRIHNFYVKMNVSALSGVNDSIHVKLTLKSSTLTDQNDQRRYLIWIALLIIILISFLYNAYAWFVFKDRAFLYYLLIVSGGIIYVTALNFYFTRLFPFRHFQVQLTKQGNIYFFDLNSLLRQMGIVMVIVGYLQFTRSYLQTKAILPKWDKVLQWAAIIYAASATFAALTTITGIWFSQLYFVMSLNIAVIAIILLIILVGCIAYKRKYVFGKYFLIANILPLLACMLAAVYFLINPGKPQDGTLFPNLAILFQTLTFAVALIARINVLKKDLGNEQLQAQSLVNNLARAEQSNKDKEVVLKEIHHRVKNNLQIINGLLFMQFKDNIDEKMKAQLRQSQERIKSMALVHNKLYESNDTVHVYIKEYIEDLARDIIKSNTPPGKAVYLNIEESESVNLSLDTSISLGLILNELITNACKYAFLSKENGRIDITIKKQSIGYQLIFKDDGVGLAKDAEQKNSMGLRLVTNLSKQLGGTAKFENNNGAVITINFVDTVAA